jgi:5-oxoprolinase (ATP-hydrolysing) subunit A
MGCMPPPIDLNADLGETPGDLALIEVVTSANIACGGHAGDETSMAAAVAAALAAGVAIGAHPAYADREGFGRTELGLPAAVVAGSVVEQVRRLAEIAASAGGGVAYLKLHGALYHRARCDTELAELLLVEMESAGFGPFPVLAQPGAVLLEAAARRGWPPVEEGFCDRAYRGDGTLVDRSAAGALLPSPEAAAAQAVALAGGVLEAAGGARLDFRPASLCVHGDSPGALETALAVRRALASAGVRLAPFAAA